MVVRTKSEDSCVDCGVITNAYDELMGRLCPTCIARRCAECGKGLEYRSRGQLYLGDFDPIEDMKYLASSNQDLLEMPLIDHSRDIDAHIAVK